MQPEVLAALTRRLARRYPQIARVRPRVRRITLPQGQVRFVVVYRFTVRTADGHRLQRSLRALVTPEGRLLKLTTSR